MESPRTTRLDLPTTTMRAAVQRGFGLPRDVIDLSDLPTPEPKPDQVLLQVAASSINALDWHYLTGTPMIARTTMGWRRPKRLIPGADIAGTVVAAGADVTRLQIGDEVFGEVSSGGFAQYVAVREDLVVARPRNLGLEESATLGVAAFTALQGLRDWGGLRPGQRVLINGSSGGVGTFAIQVARALGAEHITAVCSSHNVETARSLGADDVLDYTSNDEVSPGERFDVLFDNAGSWSLSRSRDLLEENGTLVMVTGKKGRWLAPVPTIVAARLRATTWSQKVVNKVARQSTSDLETLKAMVESGSVRPVMDRRFTLAEAVEALEYQGEGHARGKSIVVP